MIQIPQSTTRRVLLNLFTTGTTTKATGKTLAVVLSKAGGAFANPSAGATNATELSNGWYYVDLSTTDTATLGDLVVRGTATSCDDSERIFGVVLATTGGLTALPNVAAGSAGGVPVIGTGANNFKSDSAANVTLADSSLTTAKLGAFALAKTTNVTGFNDLSAAQVNAEADAALADVGVTTTVTGRIDVATSTRLPTANMPANWPASAISTDGIYDGNMVKAGGVLVELSDLIQDFLDAWEAAEVESVATGGPVTRATLEKRVLAAISGPTDPTGSVHYAPDGTTARLTVAANGAAGRTVVSSP